MKFLICLLLNFSVIFSMSNFSFKLEGKEKLCLHDYYPDQTLVTFSVDSNIADSFSIVVRDHDAKKLLEKKTLQFFKDSFTTFSGGNYEICILNEINDIISLNFEAKSGIAAKDYSTVPKLKDLAPIEKDLQKIEDASKDLYHLIMFADSHEKSYGDLQEGIVSGISMFSIIVIAVMLLIGVLETLVGKRLVESRKLK
jgi:hypothetical protein